MAGLKDGEILTDIEAMRLAIQQAELGAGLVAPNPMVGCVILSNQGRLLAKGYHARLGDAHAEVAALKQIQDASLLQDAQVFVTLEPCAHHGRTPPCAETLAQLPLKRVVYGLQDPNPKVAGKGLEVLRQAQIQVENLPELEGELEDLAEIFLFNHREGRAFTLIKVATTMDGHMAEVGGFSQWITGEDAREHAHFLRGCYDSVAVGSRTFLTDDPRLNVRHTRFPLKANKVLVMDPDGEGLKKLPTSQLWKTHKPENIIWVCRKDPGLSADFGERMPRAWVVTFDEKQGFDWAELTRRALNEGLTSILVEGGAGLIGHLMTNRQAQRWTQFIAPDLMGAKSALNVGAYWGSGQLNDRVRLLRPVWRQLGRDFLLSGRLP